VSILVNSHLDLWILGVLSRTEQVAEYGAATRLAVLLSVPLLIVNSVIPPLLARLKAESNPLAMQSLLQGTASIAAIPTIVLLFVVSVWGKEIMVLFFGSDYRAGGAVLMVLSLGHLVNVLTGSCGYALIITGNQQLVMGISILATALMLFGGLYFGSRLGALGIAFAFAGSMTVQNILMWTGVRWKCGVWTHAEPWRCLYWVGEFRAGIRK
jgi:O-antigen/teichoic acid export membrane protein